MRWHARWTAMTISECAHFVPAPTNGQRGIYTCICLACPIPARGTPSRQWHDLLPDYHNSGSNAGSVHPLTKWAVPHNVHNMKMAASRLNSCGAFESAETNTLLFAQCIVLAFKNLNFCPVHITSAASTNYTTCTCNTIIINMTRFGHVCFSSEHDPVDDMIISQQLKRFTIRNCLLAIFYSWLLPTFASVSLVAEELVLKYLC